MPGISIARSAAHAILLAIEAGLGHSDDLLRDHALMTGMPDADRRLTTTLVLGVLRWQLQLDRSVRAHMIKQNAKLDPAVLVALRLGAFQLLHLDRVPAHAAINESVELVKRLRYRSAAGLVNAVLRKIANAATEQSRDAVTAHPAWIVDRWTSFFGRETTGVICIHDQLPPDTAIRVTVPSLEQELIQAGLTVSPGSLLDAARVVESGDVTATGPFREGRVRIQDEGSQLVGEIAAIAAEGAESILDCCAAPGGKTLILAERNPEAQIVACEASHIRLEQLRDRLSALVERVECRLADAMSLNFDAQFDVVLADVPCSGTGTLSRNPEIRYRLKPEDLPRQAERQRAILASALRAVRPGARVVYSTCSLEPEENEEVVRAEVESNEKAHVVPLGPVLEKLRDRDILSESSAERLQECVTPEGFLRIVPGRFGTDGFFIAMMERRSGQSGYSGPSFNSA